MEGEGEREGVREGEGEGEGDGDEGSELGGVVAAGLGEGIGLGSGVLYVPTTCNCSVVVVVVPNLLEFCCSSFVVGIEYDMSFLGAFSLSASHRPGRYIPA